MLPYVVTGNRFFIAIGLPLRNTKFCDHYFAALQRFGLIRLKTSKEIYSELETDTTLKRQFPAYQ
jgi:hypothetical protein